MTNSSAINKMTEDILNDRVSESVARKMSGEIATLTMKEGDYSYIMSLLVHNGRSARVGLSALDLCNEIPYEFNVILSSLANSADEDIAKSAQKLWTEL